MSAEPALVPFREALRAWIRVAASSFGGPAGQISVVHRVVVEEKGWLDEESFLRALSYCMLLPGPEAQQLVTYVGWRLHGLRGGLVAGSLFIVPGFVAILVLSILYVSYGDTGPVAGLFFGLKPAVLPIVLEAVFRLRRRAASGWIALIIAAAAFFGIFALGIPFPIIVLCAAAVGVVAWRPSGVAVDHGVGAPPGSAGGSGWRNLAITLVVGLALWLVPVLLLARASGLPPVFGQEAVFFSKVAVVTFGGAYAVLSYVAQQAVEVFGWMNPGEMLDGLGMAETTPGPLIMVVQFVGFVGAYRNPGALDPLLAGVLGSLITVWVTFVPCFLFIFAGAPFVERLIRHSPLAAALRGVTAAVVGVVLNLAVWFGVHTLFGEVGSVTLGPASIPWPDFSTFSAGTAIVAAAAAVAVFRMRVGMLPTLGGGALLGALLYAAGMS